MQNTQLKLKMNHCIKKKKVTTFIGTACGRAKTINMHAGSKLLIETQQKTFCYV